MTPAVTRAPVAAPVAVSRTFFVAPMAVLSIVALALVHLISIGRVDPVEQTMSMYGVHPQSAGLFALGCTALAVACLALAHRLPRPGRPAAYGAAVMLVLLVAFPTDTGDGPLSLSAQIHRYAAGAAFVLIALTMCAAVRHTTSRGVLVALIAVAAIVLALTVIGAFAPDVAAISQWRGIPQRVLLLDYAIAIALIGGRPRQSIPT